ncbi:MAG TPA: CRISPR-associated endonuclease Cas6 [Bacteroidales bacterium]|nr:CRISPR-associated endonuclease Cas6 [Bacteroidales bacterium]
MLLPQTIIRFPEIKLRQRDAHKLRGYFGNLFKERSVLLHNHMGNGEFRYHYPLVQYKVIENVPVLVGLGEGARLLTNLFLEIEELDINGHQIPVHHKHIESHKLDIGISEEMQRYRFKTLWMGLNQKNHHQYLISTPEERKQLLEKILTGNLLSFFKYVDLHVKQQIRTEGQFIEKQTRFKNRKMLAFDGIFVSNVTIPDLIGLGKSVARGFGTIKRIE